MTWLDSSDSTWLTQWLDSTQVIRLHSSNFTRVESIQPNTSDLTWFEWLDSTRVTPLEWFNSTWVNQFEWLNSSYSIWVTWLDSSDSTQLNLSDLSLLNSTWLIDWLYQSFTAHQHQKGHTVPKQVSPLDDDDDDDITESTRKKMIIQSENCTV